MIPLRWLYPMPAVCLFLRGALGSVWFTVLWWFFTQPGEFHLNTCRLGFCQWLERIPLQISLLSSILPACVASSLSQNCSLFFLNSMRRLGSVWVSCNSAGPWNLPPGSNSGLGLTSFVSFLLEITVLCCLLSNVWKTFVSCILPVVLVVCGRTAVPRAVSSSGQKHQSAARFHHSRHHYWKCILPCDL